MPPWNANDLLERILRNPTFGDVAFSDVALDSDSAELAIKAYLGPERFKISIDLADLPDDVDFATTVLMANFYESYRTRTRPPRHNPS
jgi:hypothetical protein